MPYTQMWEIMDDKGVIHSGNEEEMKDAFDVMTLSERMVYNYYGKQKGKQLIEKYVTEWSGDLKLFQIHEVHA